MDVPQEIFNSMQFTQTMLSTTLPQSSKVDGTSSKADFWEQLGDTLSNMIGVIIAIIICICGCVLCIYYYRKNVKKNKKLLKITHSTYKPPHYENGAKNRHNNNNINAKGHNVGTNSPTVQKKSKSKLSDIDEDTVFVSNQLSHPRIFGSVSGMSNLTDVSFGLLLNAPATPLQTQREKEKRFGSSMDKDKQNENENAREQEKEKERSPSPDPSNNSNYSGDLASGSIGKTNSDLRSKTSFYSSNYNSTTTANNNNFNDSHSQLPSTKTRLMTRVTNSVTALTLQTHKSSSQNDTLGTYQDDNDSSRHNYKNSSNKDLNLMPFDRYESIEEDKVYNSQLSQAEKLRQNNKEYRVRLQLGPWGSTSVTVPVSVSIASKVDDTDDDDDAEDDDEDDNDDRLASQDDLLSGSLSSVSYL